MKQVSLELVLPSDECAIFQLRAIQPIISPIHRTTVRFDLSGHHVSQEIIIGLVHKLQLPAMFEQCKLQISARRLVYKSCIALPTLLSPSRTYLASMLGRISLAKVSGREEEKGGHSLALRYRPVG